MSKIDTSVEAVASARADLMTMAETHRSDYVLVQVLRRGEALVNALAAERDALKAAKWDVKHTDTMNDVVQMGMARDEAIADRDRLAAEVARLRAALWFYTLPPRPPSDVLSEWVERMDKDRGRAARAALTGDAA
jgi:hypothetical protein